MGELYNKVLHSMKENQENIKNGGVNCIPWPFERMRHIIPGIRHGRYYMITAEPKVGKTQLSVYIIFNAILYCYNHRNLKIKVYCFPLEETPEIIFERFISFMLHYYSRGEKRFTPSALESTEKAIPDEILSFIENNDKFKDVLAFFEEVVVFSSLNKPTGIYKYLIDEADKVGTIHHEEYKDSQGDIQTKISGYTPNDPNEYRIIWIDHIGLIGLENGMNLFSSIQKLSSNYLVDLRNKFNYIPFIVQQQMAQNTDNEKFDKVEPSWEMLSDNKATSKDVNILIGLWSPLDKNRPNKFDYNWRDLGRNGRIMKICCNRDGVSGDSLPLFMDGAVSHFHELPAPNSPDMNREYQLTFKLKNEK